MKTQISNLRSGVSNQILNPMIDYSHSGSNQTDVESTWNRVSSENDEIMKVVVKGIQLVLKANWSLSRKSVNYFGSLSKEDLEDKFNLKAAKKEVPYISIQYGNIIVVSNGKNSHSHICPSLIEIV